MKRLLQITTLLLLGFLLKAQPNISLWHVTDPVMHEQDHTKGASYINCGGYIYSKVNDGLNTYHFDILNEGSAPLTIVSVSLSPNSSPGFEFETAPNFVVVNPGEDVSFEVTYTKPNPYEPGKGFNITVVTDDPRKNYCSFSAGVGLQPIASYCVCNGDSIYTKDISDGSQLQYNEYVIHSGECSEMEVCPDSSEVNCYLSRGNLFTDLKNQDCELDFRVSYEIFDEGFCPCQLEETDVCIEPLGDTSNPCPDTVVYAAIGCEFDMNLSQIIEHKFKWYVSGFGQIVGSDTGNTVTIVDFLPSDILYLFISNVNDPEACVDVKTSIIGRRIIAERFDINRIDENLCANGTITLCLNTFSTDVLRSLSNNKRGQNLILQSTNPDVVFGEQFDVEGQICFDVSGLNPFDAVAAYCEEDNCITAFGIYYQNACENFCDILVTENVEFGPEGSQISLDDPCNCGDPENVLNPDGSVLLFHDVLSIDVGIANANSPVVITDLNGQFKQMDGTSFGVINTMADANGFVYQDYWHSLGDQAIVAIGVANLEYTYFTAICSDPCAVIPTMGQWAILILLTMFAITGVVFVRQQRLSPKHQ